jgi:hypothetical protein
MRAQRGSSFSLVAVSRQTSRQAGEDNMPIRVRSSAKESAQLMLNLPTQHARFGVDLCLRRGLRSCWARLYLSARLLDACAHDAALRRSRNPGIYINQAPSMSLLY